MSLPTTLLSLFLALVATGAAAQSVSADFGIFDRVPFGPGDRSLEIELKFGLGETTSSLAAWVIYGEDRTAVAAATLEGSAPRGRARLRNAGADGSRWSFVFPHADHPTPNAEDRAQVSIRSGRTVHYKVVKLRGAAVVNETPIVTFVMPDKLTIANFGDSFASGEGAPHDGLTAAERWDDVACHRSSNSGQARAVQTLKRENPGTAIAFKNVACSGAQLVEGILQSQKVASWFLEPPALQTPVRPQLDVVRQWLADMSYAELNIAMISGGGNDVDFGSYVETFLVLPNEMKAVDGNTLRRTITQDIPTLYTALRDAFDRTLPYDQVLVSEYPDPLRGKDGRFCDLPLLASPRAEFEVIDDSFLRPLNDTIRTTIATFQGWRYIGGTMAASRNHGLCNGEQPYFHNGLVESVFAQGDPYGTVHPTREGHRKIYQPALEEALRAALREIRKKWAKEETRIEHREHLAQMRAERHARLRVAAAQPLSRAAPVRRRQPLAQRTVLASEAERARQAASRMQRRPESTADHRMKEDKE